MSALFEPISIGSLELSNRIVMSPMCMGSADEQGFVTDWHLLHYPTRAVGGAGLIMIEATAVESRGRIWEKDLGIWSDKHIDGLRELVDRCHQHGARVGIQLAHAGRKARIKNEKIVSSIDEPFSPEDVQPVQLKISAIKGIIHSFQEAARRAMKAGFDVIEIHGAHGYLINQFLSAHTNKRKDQYGGSIKARSLILMEIIDAVRKIWAKPKPLFVRLSAVDHIESGNDIGVTKKIISYLKSKVDIWDLSSGGIAPLDIKPYYGFQVPYSETIKRELNVKTGAVGMIKTPEMAEEIILNNRADLVFLGRELLRDPYWPLHAAEQLGVDADWPGQYNAVKK